MNESNTLQDNRNIFIENVNEELSKFPEIKDKLLSVWDSMADRHESFIMMSHEEQLEYCVSITLIANQSIRHTVARYYPHYDPENEEVEFEYSIYINKK